MPAVDQSGRPGIACSAGSQSGQALVDVVEMVLGVVQGMLEQPTHVAASCANGEAPSPCVEPGVLGDLRQALGCCCQRVDDGLWISVGVGGGNPVELVVGDIGERGLGVRQWLFHTVGVQHCDVAAVRRVLDRRPCIWLGSLTQVAAGIRELTTPAAAERSQRREQRGVVENVTIETARLAALVFGPHRRQSGRRHTTTARYPPPVAAIRQAEFALQARGGSTIALLHRFAIADLRWPTPPCRSVRVMPRLKASFGAAF